VDWDDLLSPLEEAISPWLSLVFAAYIAFSVLAMMNVVTGVFVESALASARADREAEVVNQVRRLFQVTDRDSSGSISWEEFCAALDDDDMSRFMKSLDIDTEEAKGLFLLLDTDGSGTVDSEEFTQGCLRLRGPARAIDVSTLMYSNKRMVMWWREKIQSLEVSLMCIQEYLDEMPIGFDGSYDTFEGEGAASMNCSESPRGIAELPQQSDLDQSRRISAVSELHAVYASASCPPAGLWERQESSGSFVPRMSTADLINEVNRRASSGDAPRVPRKSMAERTRGIMAMVEKESQQEQTFLATWADLKAEGIQRSSNFGHGAEGRINNSTYRGRMASTAGIPE